MGKRTVLIIYDAGVKGLESAAGQVKSAADSQLASGARVLVKTASDASVPDLLAADVILLGADGIPGTAWSEVARFFGNANLAGRACGFFTLGTPATTAKLLEMVKPSDILVLSDALQFSSARENSLLGAWMSKALALRVAS